MRLCLGSLPDYNAALQAVNDAWSDPREDSPRGFVSLGSVSPASINYTTKYLVQDDPFDAVSGQLVRSDSKLYEDYRLQRRPVFANMSKNLGSGYLASRSSWHLDDTSRFYAVLDGGSKVNLPRYYRERIYNEEELRIHRETLELKKHLEWIEDCRLPFSVREERQKIFEGQQLLQIRNYKNKLKHSLKI